MRRDAVELLGDPSGNPGSGNDYTFTIMLDGGITTTSISCQIAGGTATTCTDTTAPTTLALTPGKVVNVTIVPTSTPTTRTATWTATFTNDGTSFNSPIQ